MASNDPHRGSLLQKFPVAHRSDNPLGRVVLTLCPRLPLALPGLLDSRPPPAPPTSTALGVPDDTLRVNFFGVRTMGDPETGVVAPSDFCEFADPGLCPVFTCCINSSGVKIPPLGMKISLDCETAESEVWVRLSLTGIGGGRCSTGVEVFTAWGD